MNNIDLYGLTWNMKPFTGSHRGTNKQNFTFTQKQTINIIYLEPKILAECNKLFT